jgi:hypothetical protein
MDKRKSVYLLLVWLSLSWPGSADKLQVMGVSSVLADKQELEFM